jgi:hypothetical protein
LEYAKILTQVEPGNPFRKVVLWWKQRAASRRIDAFLGALVKERQLEKAKRDPVEGRDKEGLGKRTMSVLDHILVGLSLAGNGGQVPDTLTPAVVQTIVEK